MPLRKKLLLQDGRHEVMDPQPPEQSSVSSTTSLLRKNGLLSTLIPQVKLRKARKETAGSFPLLAKKQNLKSDRYYVITINLMSQRGRKASFNFNAFNLSLWHSHSEERTPE